VQQIRYFRVGANGSGNIVGAYVPKGQVWLIRAAGLFTDDGRYIEWMMQILVNDRSGRACRNRSVGPGVHAHAGSVAQAERDRGGDADVGG
jgi:hypothetical protein